MTNRAKRLELTWIGKEDRPRLEPRVLLEDEELSYAKRVSDDDIFDNRLIHGDNLLALKALEQEFRGQVKCVYIDPPFNTGAAFAHYDDGVEHSLWLALMRQRLELLHGLLRADGVLWLHLDDSEAAYAKVILDEVFGRTNYRNTVTVAANSPFGFKSTSRSIFKSANQLLVYSKSPRFEFLKSYVARGYDKAYKYVLEHRTDDCSTWAWSLISDVVARAEGFVDTRAARKAWGSEELDDRIAEFAISNAERVFRTASVTGGAKKKRLTTLERSRAERDKAIRHPGDDMDYCFIAGERVLFYNERLVDIGGQRVPGESLTDIWTDVSWEGIAREGGVEFPKGKKPEALLKRILSLSSSPGDLVLDSFGGSGTTAAVAHKMRRRWITIEFGPHAQTHCVPRLRSVVDGTDRSGASEATAWKGGGGFRFFRLAPSLLEKDKWGNWIVSRQYRPEVLAEAVCKLEGFRYAPDHEAFWNHGRSTERDFIYVTTQNLSADQLRFISEQVGPERTLLVCCGAFRGKPDFPNLTLKRIPHAVLKRCEWSRDDYSLNVSEQAPVVAVEEAKAGGGADDQGQAKSRGGGRRRRSSAVQDLPLFHGADQGSKK